ncbi:MAG: hypothetical protein E6J20_04405 [Chloroflexi bacterium]|nr:MAG: hypothetical protein E6J20_04405 [Chloroflexota bacterium]
MAASELSWSSTGLAVRVEAPTLPSWNWAGCQPDVPVRSDVQLHTTAKFPPATSWWSSIRNDPVHVICDQKDEVVDAATAVRADHVHTAPLAVYVA